MTLHVAGNRVRLLTSFVAARILVKPQYGEIISVTQKKK